MNGMMEQMSAEQFRGWQAYAALEPFGPLHEDFRAGQLCSTIANTAVGGPGRKALLPADFFAALAEQRSERKPMRSRSDWKRFTDAFAMAVEPSSEAAKG